MGCVEGDIRVLGERKICALKKQKCTVHSSLYNRGELDRGTWEEIGPDGRALREQTGSLEKSG
jgi:hypothetical protein